MENVRSRSSWNAGYVGGTGDSEVAEGRREVQYDIHGVYLRIAGITPTR